MKKNTNQKDCTDTARSHKKTTSTPAERKKELQQTILQYQTAIKDSKDIIHVINKDLRVIFVNQACLQSLKEHHLDTEPLGRDIFSVYPFLSEKVKEEYISVFKTNTSLFTEEKTFINGTTYWTETNKIPIFDKDDNATQVLTILRDITDRKKAEEALAQSEQEHKNLLEFSPYPITIHRNGIVLYVNKEAVRLMGYGKPEEILGARILQFINPLYHNLVLERIEKHEKGTTVPTPIEVEFITPAGKAKYIELTSIKTIFNSEHAIMTMGKDITEDKKLRDDLKVREEFFRTIFELSPDGIYISRLSDGVFIDINPSSAEHIGRDRDDIINHSSNDLGIWQQREEQDSYISELKKHGIVKNYEANLKNAQGNVDNVLLSSRLIDIYGEPHIITFSRIITDYINTKKALYESEKRIKQILENTFDIICTFDLEGNFLDVNDALIKLSNYRRDEIIKKNFVIFLHPEDIIKALESLEKNRNIKNSEVEIRARDRDGTYKWLHLITRPVMDEYGKVKEILTIGRDITDKKTAEEALKKSEEKYRLLVENANDLIFILQDDVIKYSNLKVKQVIGIEDEKELLNNPFWTLIHPEDRDMVKERYYRRMKGENVPSTYQYRILQKSGKEIWVELNAGMITWDDRPAVLAIMRDVTAKKKLENRLRQAQNMEAIGLLAGAVAHDLNNILSGIVSYPDLLLLDLPEDSPLRDAITTIKRSGEKASAIVQDMLTLARRGITTKEVININAITSSYLDSPEHTKLKKTYPLVSLSCSLENELLNIIASQAQIVKTIMNLVTNAYEAIPNNGKISVSTKNVYLDRPVKGYDSVNEGEYICLSVSDTGSGIAEDDIERIFEPFYSKKVMGRSGTGLGMAVVSGTVSDLNGYIEIETELDRGSCFKIYFPVTKQEINHMDSIVPLQEYMGHGEKILIIDDIADQRKIATDILKKLNYTVMSLSSGEQAVEYLKSNSADLIILDMIMEPGIDGYETFKKIHDINPDQKAIIASGYSETSRVKETQLLGAGEYMKKPYSLKNIGIAVKKELDKK